MKRILISLISVALMFSLSSVICGATETAENDGAMTKLDASHSEGTENVYIDEKDETNIDNYSAETIELRYVSVQSVKVGFSISSSQANCACRIVPQSSSSISSVSGTFKIINSSGTTVKSYQQNMTKSSGKYYFSKTYKLPARGKYHLKATMKCYKNGTLKDTITKNSVIVTY